MRLLKLGLAVVGVLAVADSARAQFFFRPVFPYTYQPALYTRTTGASAFFNSPTGGYGFSTHRSYFSSSPLLIYNAPAVNPAMYGGFYYVTPSAAGLDAVGARQAGAIQKAQREVRNDPVARQQVFDQFLAAKQPDAANAEVLKDAGAGLKKAVNDPGEEAVLSGVALNEILKAANGYEGKGVKAAAPFLPADLLAAVTFKGGPTADAVNWLRAGKLDLPESIAQRDAVEKAFAAISASLNAGKKPEPFLLDKLADTAAKAKAGAQPDDAAVLARVVAAAKVLKEPSAAGLIVPDWKTAGASLADVSKWMAGHKLAFAQAPAGEAAAYFAMHRGLAGYLTALAAAAKKS